MKFKARTNENRQLEVNWDRVNEYLSQWKPLTWLDIEITRRKRTISDPLRRYYFAVVIPAIAEHSGYERDEYLKLHEFLKARYFGCERDSWGIYRNVPSVFSNESVLSVPEKKKFVDHVVRKAAQFGVYIPDPNE